MNQKKYRDVLPCGYQLHWYKLLSVLGRGAYGITYLALDTNLQQSVAIKEYLPNEFASREHDQTVHPTTGDQQEIYDWGLNRFLHEARTLAKFKHHNIVRVLSVFEKNNTAYMVMEYEQGEDLAQILKKNKQMPENALLDIFIPILDGLSLVHAEGFTHRDIKPSNIYIRQDQSPVLIDFGSARQTKRDSSHALTSLVTYGYAPFEQYNEGEDRQGPWTDLYAMAASLYLAIIGKLPMDALSRGSALLNDGVDPYEPVSTLAKQRFSGNFLLAVDNAMMFRAQDRPQNVTTWTDMLTGKILSPPLPATLLVPKNKPDDGSNTVLVPGNYISFRHTGGRTPQSAHQADSTVVRATSPSQRVDTDHRKHIGSAEKKTFQPAVVQPLSAVLNNKKRIALGTFLLALISIAIVATLSNTAPKKRNTPTPTEQNPPIASRIAELLQLAQSNLASQNILAPKNNNARQHYLDVLKIDPNNNAAKEGLKKVIELQVTLIEAQLNNKFINEATRNIALLTAIAPNFPTTLTLQRKLENMSVSKQRTEIDTLLQQAKQHVKAYRLIKPNPDNAFNRYQRILDIDPDNNAAKKGIQEIISYYQSTAEQQLTQQNYSNVSRIIKNIEYINPDSATAKQLAKKLSRAKQKRQRITTLLAAANRDFKTGNIVNPADKNAFYRYQQVLVLDPSNPKARQGLINIENHYKKQFDTALTKNDLLQAGSILSILQAFAPNAATTQRAVTELASAQKTATTTSSRPNIDAISEIIGKYKSYFESGNARELENISDYKPGRQQFVNQFFDQYQSVEVVISGFRYIGKEQKGLASISLTQLENKRGHTIKPGTWSKFEIIVNKNSQREWKVVW
ncbi:MAG: protein kinase [Gammaproteobacteria bacterium]|nr:protein kinase [Gammaproteobacteria bacterium]